MAQELQYTIKDGVVPPVTNSMRSIAKEAIRSLKKNQYIEVPLLDKSIDNIRSIFVRVSRDIGIPITTRHDKKNNIFYISLKQEI